MTWTINVNGHDDLTGDEKAAYENDVVERVRALVSGLITKEGGRVTKATIYTNTTDTVNLLA